MDGAAVDPIEPAIARDDDRTTHTAVERIRERLESRVNPSSTPPPELIGEAARRLGSLGLVYSCGVLFSYFGRRALLTWSGTIDSGVRASDAIALAAVLM